VNQDVVTAERPDAPGPEHAGDDGPVAPEAAVTAARTDAEPGERLKAARIGMGMSVSDVARHLKLHPRQVEALEHGDHQALPGEVFVRGFTRNYARLVGLDADTLAGATMRPPAPGAGTAEAGQGRAAVWTSVTEGPVFEEGAARARKRWWPVTLGLIVVAAVLLYLGRERLYPEVPVDTATVSTGDVADEPAQPGAAGQDPAQPAAGTPIDPATAPATSSEPAQAAGTVPDVGASPAGAAANPTTAPRQADGAGRSPVADAPPGPVAAEASAAGRPGDAAAAGGPALKLAFTQDSWVEVRDGSGAVVFSQMGTAGSERVVRGQPPLRLTVGNASGVRVNFRSRDVDLAPHTQSEVAHVTLE